MKKYLLILVAMVCVAISANAQTSGNIPITESKLNKETMKYEEVITGYLEWSATIQNSPKGGCFVTVKLRNTSPTKDVSAGAYTIDTESSCGRRANVRSKGVATITFGCNETVKSIDVSYI